MIFICYQLVFERQVIINFFIIICVINAIIPYRLFFVYIKIFYLHSFDIRVYLLFTI